MAGKPHNQKALVFLQKFLLNKTWSKLYFQRKTSNSNGVQSQIEKYPLVSNKKTLMFHMEGAILRSSSVFPYFMLVAFEAGGLLRALILFLLYPIICLVGKEWGLKIMVFVCFVGLKEESFRIGRTVLPKFLLEDVGCQVFDMVMKCGGKKIAVTDMPRVMVEFFLKDYMKVETVVGRELKVVCGHYVGLMEEKKAISSCFDQVDSSVIGTTCFNSNQQIFSCCEVLYMASEADKKNWQTLPRDKYPKPLIFHDGRLAFRPTPVATLFMFMWIPFGLFLLIVRVTMAYFLPYKSLTPFLYFTGLKSTLIRPNSIPDPADADVGQSQNGVLYVCNHKTLLDPIYVSMVLAKPVTAVTYSLSPVTELFSPIKTVRLTRNREKDSKLIENQLKQGDLVICPEGTTCREPYLLRFSPLFAEITDEIVPVAIDFQVSMFYGTTASGFKFLDPVFLLMSPTTHCSATILEKLPKALTCQGGRKSKFEVANHVQAQIAKALNYECTGLTRRDKYMILAGNEGIVH